MNANKRPLLHLLLTILSPCAFAPTLSAQSVAALQRQAEKSLSQKKYAAAASQFERAGRLHNSDPALLYQAAEAYQQVRDYLNASNGYRAAKDDPRFPLASLRYARALKQQGRYEEAKEAFQKTGETYQGDYKAIILPVVENEIAGCNLAVQLLEKQDTTTIPSTIIWLNPPVASQENEFAPLPFSDTLLYFTKAQDQKALLMRSTKRAGVWQLPQEAQGLPATAATDFLCGAFSPDGQRFYFARSEAPPSAMRGSSAQASGGTLYVLRHNAAGEWGEPERLRPYINLEGSSNLWPFVCHIGEEEWLFFASDKAGGMGGMDLYGCKRPLDADDVDFSFPLNLGKNVNTGGDDITPYYDIFAKTLWFSSIGHPSLGGLDVHFSLGEGNTWTKAANAGIPINSPADDFFFALKRDNSGAFLVSNRAVFKEKESTADDDLFEVFFPQQD
jgi:hypothetical protein